MKGIPDAQGTVASCDSCFNRGDVIICEELCKDLSHYMGDKDCYQKVKVKVPFPIGDSNVVEPEVIYDYKVEYTSIVEPGRYLFIIAGSYLFEKNCVPYIRLVLRNLGKPEINETFTYFIKLETQLFKLWKLCEGLRIRKPDFEVKNPFQTSKKLHVWTCNELVGKRGFMYLKVNKFDYLDVMSFSPAESSKDFQKQLTGGI